MTTQTNNTFPVIGWDKQLYNVTIEKNKSIQIDCTYTNAHDPKPTTVKFQIGDAAEYHSYNLSYMGKIISITEKTVTIQTGTEIKRLKLPNFCWRNWDFNLEKKIAENQNESYYI